MDNDTSPCHVIISKLQNKLGNMEGGYDMRQSSTESDNRNLNLKKSVCMPDHEMGQDVAEGFSIASNQLSKWKC